MRDPRGAYLGTLEVSQDLTPKRALEGEQRLLSYGEKTVEAETDRGSVDIPITAAAPGS